MTKYSFAAGIAWGALVVSLSSPASAQAEGTSSAPQNGAVAPSTDAAASAGLEDIVVTAQRRSENLQRVPIAVTALSAATLEARGISDIRSLTTVTPGLQYNTTTNISLIFMRGVGTEDLSLGDEPSVATYVDGVYFPSAYGSNSSLPDVERVEVLKGPQGTLFGRNALGGVINITTRAPSHDPKLEAVVSYSRFNTVDASVYGSAGLTDTLAFGISASYHNQADGFGRNLTTGNDVFKSKSQAYRGKLVWEPSSLTKLTLAGYYDTWRGDLGHDRRPIPGATMIGGTTYQGFYNIQNNFDGFTKMPRYGGSLTYDQDLGFARLVAIGSLQHLKDTVRLDQDGTPVPAVQFVSNNTYQRTRTAELQLQSQAASKLKWIMGFYYFNDLAAYQPLTVVGAFNRYIKVTARSYSGFGQVTYPIMESLRLTAGLRYTSDDRGRSGYSLNGAGTVVTVPFTSASKTFGKLTWRFSADYDIAPDILGYISYNRGFKSGIYNSVNLADPVVKPEVLDAYEAGLKTQLFDRKLRLNGSVFYYDHSNIQSSQFNQGVLSLINAARGKYYGAELEGEALISTGLKLQFGGAWESAHYKSFPGAPLFTPIAAGGNTQTPGDASGNQIIRAPKFTGNAGLTYETNVAGGIGYANTSYYYNDGFYWKPDNRVHQGSYSLVNATIGWRSPNNRFDVSLWGKNILSEHYYIYENEDTFGDSGSPAAPATYGVTVRVKFGS